MTSLVFVYGTLKSGYRANYKLEGGEYIGPAKTPPIFQMFGRGAGFPMITLVEENGHEVLGEVYRVNEATMQSLDQYEGVPHFYKRMRVAAIVDKPEWPDPIDVWIYHVKKDQLSGGWSGAIEPNKDGVLIWAPQKGDE